MPSQPHVRTVARHDGPAMLVPCASHVDTTRSNSVAARLVLILATLRLVDDTP